MILIIFIINVLICLTSMLTFALKMMVNKIIVAISCGWWTNAKKEYVGKIVPCKFFQTSLNKFSLTQILATENPPKKYAFSDATVSVSLKIL